MDLPNGEILEELQRQFPKELTIAVQAVKIQKLEAEIDEIKMPTDREILIKHPEMKPSTLKKLDAIDKELASGKLKTRGSQTKEMRRQQLQAQRDKIINKFDQEKLNKTLSQLIKNRANKKRSKKQ